MELLLLKIYCEGKVNEVNKTIVRERLREFIEEGGKTEVAEWLEKAQEIGMSYRKKFQEIKDKLKTFVVKELDKWLVQGRKKKESKDESNNEEDEKEKVVTSMYERLSGTENELTKADIRRILELGFDQYEMIIDGFVREYKSIQEKDDKEVHRILYSYLVKRGIIRNLEEEDTDDTDESDLQRTPEIEIINPDEDEEINSNNSNLGNIEIESDLSDTEIQIPIIPIITMATIDQVMRVMENALGLPNNALNAPLANGEDVNDWIRQFEVAFTATGKDAGNNGARQAAVQQHV
ncbi:hypothetical protein C1646_774483 [Rhizophagus diaphanus]|nr:hypothetical protein C1646_774483 [Rhizophagus diaphanus] [Rhizophagus sp. MUCL 43196]